MRQAWPGGLLKDVTTCTLHAVEVLAQVLVTSQVWQATDTKRPLVQVSGQLAGKCAELMQSQSELRQAHHMLAAAYAANAALQVRFQHVSCCHGPCCAVPCRAMLCCASPVPTLCMVSLSVPMKCAPAYLSVSPDQAGLQHLLGHRPCSCFYGSTCCLCKIGMSYYSRLLAEPSDGLRWAVAERKRQLKHFRDPW